MRHSHFCGFYGVAWFLPFLLFFSSLSSFSPHLFRLSYAWAQSAARMQELDRKVQLAAGAIGVNRNASVWADVFVPWSRPNETRTGLRVKLILIRKHAKRYKVCFQEALIIVVEVKRPESVYLPRPEYGQWLQEPCSCPGAGPSKPRSCPGGS